MDSQEAADQRWAEGFAQVQQDMPAVPVYNATSQSVWSKRLDNVVCNVRGGMIDLTEVTITS